MFKKSGTALTTRTQSGNADKWIESGWKMAHHEGSDEVFDSIAITHEAEKSEQQVIAEDIHVKGSIILQKSNSLRADLNTLQFTPTMYVELTDQARVDFIFAMVFATVNVALASFTLAAFGPTWMAVITAFAILGSCVAVEEFLVAHEKGNAFWEGVFIVAGLLCVAAQFYLGGLRAALLAVTASAGSGKVSDFLIHAGITLKYVLGIFALISEFMCGFKVYSWRTRYFSAGACATRELSRCLISLQVLQGELEAAKAEAGIRQHYRTIGARQYLASNGRRRKAFEGRHLVRASIGAAIALVAIIIFLFFAPALFGAGVQGVSIVIVDRSESVGAGSYAANVGTVPKIIDTLGIGDRVVVIGTGNDFGSTETLFDAVLPSDGGFMGVNLEAAREGVVANWSKVAAKSMLKHTFTKTDLLGALSYLRYLGVPLNSRTRLYILSDLRQYSRDVDLEHVAVVDVGTAIAKVHDQGAVVSLPGVAVYLLAADPGGITEKHFNSLIDFWRRYFKDAKANIKIITVGRSLPELP